MKASDKLQLLTQSGVIDETVRSAVDSQLDWLRADLFLDIDTDGVGQMLVTHLAMATRRALQGESIDPPSAEDPAVTDADRSLAAALLERVSATSGATFPPGETAYVAAYLSAVKSAS
jgi:hypothetical protein